MLLLPDTVTGFYVVVVVGGAGGGGVAPSYFIEL